MVRGLIEVLNQNGELVMSFKPMNLMSPVASRHRPISRTVPRSPRAAHEPDDCGRASR